MHSPATRLSLVRRHRRRLLITRFTRVVDKSARGRYHHSMDQRTCQAYMLKSEITLLTTSGDPVTIVVEPMRVEGLAQELRNLREAAGLSQEILGSLIGLPQKTVEAMENDRQRIPPNVETMWRNACRQYMAYKAIRFGAVPRTAAKFDSEEDAQRFEDALQQSLDRARMKKQKRSKPTG